MKLNFQNLDLHLTRFVLLSVSFLVLMCQVAKGDTTNRISRNELKPLEDGTPGELGLRKELVLATNLKMTAAIKVTTKGNGRMRIGNLNLKVYDSHDDGSYYENGLLSIDIPDINGDGTCELVISGIVCFTDEKGKMITRREAVVFIYVLQSNQTFKQVYRNTDIDIDMNLTRQP